MPEDEAPYSSVEPGVEHYYLEICTVRRVLPWALAMIVR
jgi:hypothetical protein